VRIESALTDSLVAVAASAGGLKALTALLSALPAELPVPVVVVQHLHREAPSALAAILDRRCAISVREATDGVQLSPATVYVAARDRHLVVNADATLSLTTSELVHFVRPSADVLFESAASAYRGRLMAIVLTGAGSDGAAGVKAVKAEGGYVLAQDPATSDAFGMPAAAIDTDAVDQVLALEDIAPALMEWVGRLGSNS
jgi:two-component system chemotaxis response regulator CheB